MNWDEDKNLPLCERSLKSKCGAVNGVLEVSIQSSSL